MATVGRQTAAGGATAIMGFLQRGVASYPFKTNGEEELAKV